MTLSETQVFGFGENVLKLLEKERSVLQKGGMDMDSVLSMQGGLLEAAVGETLSARREGARPCATARSGPCGIRTHGFRLAKAAIFR